jgi:Na+-driven multidrug efflux pump
MIGRLGDLPLAAVGMAGKWTWFYGIVLFGFTSGAAVFIAQYFGANDRAGMHRTYGVMTIGTMTAALVFSSLALLMPEKIIGFLSSDPAAVETAAVYLRIIALAYPFQALRRSAGTLLQKSLSMVR